MKRYLIKFIFIFLFYNHNVIGANLNSLPIQYSDYFTKERLRVEYYLTGKQNEAHITLGNLYKEPIWGGNEKNLVDTFKYGHYLVEIYDSLGRQLLY